MLVAGGHRRPRSAFYIVEISRKASVSWRHVVWRCLAFNLASPTHTGCSRTAGSALVIWCGKMVLRSRAMTDVFSVEERSAIMRRIKSKDTAAELRVRRLIFHLGFRYRLHIKALPGAPDLVFRKRRQVIFVHGCYWHQHGCGASARPASHESYWNAKLDRNVNRDRRNLRLLLEQGWKVLVVWECEMRQERMLEERLKEFLQGDQH